MKIRPQFSIIAILLILVSSQAISSVGATPVDILEPIATLEVGGMPDAIVVDRGGGRNDVLFYDLSTSQVRFIDGDTLMEDAGQIPIETWSFEGWMAYDAYNQQTYFISVHNRGVYPNNWKEARVNVIAARELVTYFSVNEAFNSDPLNPVDVRYGIDGFAFKQPHSEGNNLGRLFIDNTPQGIVDVVDLNATGSAAFNVQRFSYRDPVETTGWQTNLGNSLALEDQHETLPSDDLATVDRVYIADANHPYENGYGYVRVTQVNQSVGGLGAVTLPKVDLNGTWPFPNGLEGLDISGARDRLYIASGMQSFDTGYAGVVDTTHHESLEVIELTYGDKGKVLVDDSDPKRVFLTTFDGFYNDPEQGLYLHLIYDDQVVDTLQLTQGFDEYAGPRGMFYDAYSQRLYLTLDTRVMVVKVNYGAAPPPPPPLVVSATIEPEGGYLATPDENIEIVFPAGAVDQTTVVTYTEQSALPSGEWWGVHFFDLRAVISGTTTPVTSFDPAYGVFVHYGGLGLGPAIEDSLGLYWWDGGQWVLENTSQVDSANDVLTASVNHMTAFAILGESQRLFLPRVER